MTMTKILNKRKILHIWFRYFRKPLRGPPTPRSPKTPQHQNRNSKNPKSSKSPKVNLISPKVNVLFPRVNVLSPKVKVKYFSGTLEEFQLFEVSCWGGHGHRGLEYI